MYELMHDAYSHMCMMPSPVAQAYCICRLAEDKSGIHQRHICVYVHVSTVSIAAAQAYHSCKPDKNQGGTPQLQIHSPGSCFNRLRSH